MANSFARVYNIYMVSENTNVLKDFFFEKNPWILSKNLQFKAIRICTQANFRRKFESHFFFRVIFYNLHTDLLF